jgi:site-specific recombinase XerD
MMQELKYVDERHVVEFKEFMTLKNFSKRTVKTYSQIVLQFLNWWRRLEEESPMNDDVVRKYLLFRFDQNKDWQTVNSDYSAIQTWFKNVLMINWSLTKLPRPMKEKKLPSILSKEDVVKIIENAHTYKQQVLLTFFYVTGVRLSEAINLKIDDVDGDRKQVRINKGKGNKDRLILIPDELLTLLRDYYKRVRPEIYLFNGSVKGKPYSQRAVQLTMQYAKKKAKITKKGSIHTLRNCYATHHLEGGTDLVFLQEQMGHKNLKTTIRYIGLCVERHRYIKHPIASLKINYRHKTV